MIPQPIDQVPLFLRLSEGERELVTARLRRRQAASGELVFTEGSTSDAMYVITSGRVKLEGGRIDSALTLANLGAGSLLGEEDMLLDRPYSTSARAAATTQLYVLSRGDLEELVAQRPAIGLKFSASLGLRIPFLDQYLIHQRLRNIELLSALSESDLRAIAERLDFHTAERGDMIIETGSPCETAYFIEEGKARMIVRAHDGDSFEELGEGSLFGHTSLITGKPYAASVRAVTDVTLWALTRTSYQELIAERAAIKLAFSRALAETLSSSDQTEAMERMRQLQMFSDVPTEALGVLASRLVLRHYPTDEVIYSEGTPGDAMYIVESGETKLLESSASNARLIERMRAGDSFGEMALLTGRTRGECARATTDTTLWVLYKTDFDDVMVQYPEISVSLGRALTERLGTRDGDFVVRHLRRIDLFANLATSELQAISKKVRGLRFRAGEIICFAGQSAETLYMIEVGEVKQTGAGPNGEPLTLEILGPGESIGVQSIIQNGAYFATTQALGELELWTISRTDFQSMMEMYPGLAITITRMMAEQLMRSQQYPQPPMGSMQGPGAGTPPAPRPAPKRPSAGMPIPSARIQRPPSGARPISAPPKPQPAPARRPGSGTQQTSRLTSPPASSSTDEAAFVPENRPQTGSRLPHLQAPHIPKPQLPHVQAPHIPKPQLPHVQAPHIQAPHIQAPHIQAPHIQAPHIQAPHMPRRQARTAVVPAESAESAFAAPSTAAARPSTGNFLSEFGSWITSLTWGARIRVLSARRRLV
ncbi:MAG: cyclic nucleotide-binding domain-containing protein, partial [Chloroflexi bacterium]|nr:cyclic nucleotide-binding domain-containing protein [Chloroflexota bacterium]